MAWGAAAADLDGDDRLDIILSGWSGPPRVWSNQGEGGFKDTSSDSGLPDRMSFGRSASFGDMDGDGDLDFFSGNLSSEIRYQENLDPGIQSTFEDPAENPFGLGDIGSFNSPAFSDADGDGDLDDDDDGADDDNDDDGDGDDGAGDGTGDYLR